MILILFLLSGFLFSCNNADKTETTTTSTTETVSTDSATPLNNKNASEVFDISQLPISEVELGPIPFFSFPNGLTTLNKPLLRNYDQLFIPINGTMTSMEGKVWKSFITKSRDNKEEWSPLYFEKSYDDAITKAGGVKIFDGKVSRDELDRIKDQATYFGEEGSINYWSDPVKVYVIHRKNGDDIFIQLSSNSAGGTIQILQKAPFEQTITMLKSDEIKKELDTKGKAVLHINFETDKATLLEDGKKAIAEIVKVLQSDGKLKLAINGYTDNTGNEEHNLKLSKDRAATVLTTIVATGIESARLTADGFGSKDPIGDNNTAAGKAENRRVELVKK